jgi:hypothetical protein
MTSRPKHSSTFLLTKGYAEGTRKRYGEAVERFLDHSDEEGWIMDDDNTDEAMCEYIHHAYFELYDGTGSGRGEANNAVFGLIMLRPRLKTMLPLSRQALKGWQKEHPGKSWPPLSWYLTVLIAIQMARGGQHDMAVATLVMFDALLRITEAVHLTRADVAVEGDLRLSGVFRGKMGLRLAKAKTGKNQWAEIFNPDVRKLLMTRLVKCGNATDRVFGFSATNYRLVFKSVMLSLGLKGYVPHSLRHGGATHLHMLDWSVDDILIRGRWVAHKSARIYIQSGRALLLQVNVDGKLLAVAQVLTKNLSLVLALIFREK